MLCLFPFGPRPSSSRLLLACLILAMLHLWPPPAAGAPGPRVFHYQQLTGDQSHPFNLTLEPGPPLHLTADSPQERHFTVMESDFSTRRWQLIQAAEGTEVLAQREGNTLRLSGRLRGQPVEQSLRLDPAPWYQALSVSLRTLLDNRIDTLEFWTLRCTPLFLSPKTTMQADSRPSPQPAPTFLHGNKSSSLTITTQQGETIGKLVHFQYTPNIWGACCPKFTRWSLCMNQLNRFAKLRLNYLRIRPPQLLISMKNEGLLETHLLSSQKYAKWELEQLVFAGMDEEAAEHLVLQEYILV